MSIAGSRVLSAGKERFSPAAIFGNCFCVQPRAVLNHPVRTPLHLVVNARDVFAKDAEADQLHAAQKQNGNHQRRNAVRAGGKPNFVNSSANTFSQKVKTAPRNAHAETARPSHVASRNGTVENENRPSIASRRDFLKVYCGVPAARSPRANSMEVCRKPHHVRRPRR